MTICLTICDLYYKCKEIQFTVCSKINSTLIHIYLFLIIPEYLYTFCYLTKTRPFGPTCNISFCFLNYILHAEQVILLSLQTKLRINFRKKKINTYTIKKNIDESLTDKIV